MTLRSFSFHYTLRDEQARVLDTSRGGDPTTFVEGTGQIIEGLESTLLGMATGEKRAVVVSPERGYGPVDETLRQRVARAELPVTDLKVGDQFQTGPDRHAPVVTVVALEGDQVLLDANHPLAGRSLHFEVELLGVRPATSDEVLASQNSGLA